MNDLYNRISELCERKGVSRFQMCKDTGLSYGFLTDLKMGRQESISTKKAAKVASYFGVPVEYLVYGSTSDAPPVLSDNELKAAFFGGGEDLTQEEIDALWEETKNYIQFRKAQMKKK